MENNEISSAELKIYGEEIPALLRNIMKGLNWQVSDILQYFSRSKF